jgi:Xaa-Pro aminopeptidase
MDYSLRRENLMRAMSGKKLDALVITHAANIRYLCGFTGSAGVFVAREPRCVFYTDGRYIAQAHEQVQGARVVIAKGSPLVAAGSWLAKVGPRSVVGIEAEHLTVAGRSAFSALLPKRVRLRDTTGLVERLRMIKEPEEIERIREAVLTGAALLDTAIAAIKPGARETAVAAAIEYAAREAGAEGMSFDTIVAAGERSALPHGRASNHAIPRNGFVVLDFGVILAGYCSDMTRTVHVGRPGAEMRALYEAVREAQQAAVNAVRAGTTTGKVDHAARQTLRRAGLARFFTHSTGHGVGLEVHEVPRVARSGADVLESGMVITIEPGAYMPGKGGVRIEDMVVVTERGVDVLTPAPKQLVVV